MSFDRDQLLDIAAKQDAKEKERRASQVAQRQQEENAAAEMIQRNYRGYRERRQLMGMGLDSSTRWVEAVREGTYSQHAFKSYSKPNNIADWNKAQYRNATRPMSRRQRDALTPAEGDAARRNSDLAKNNWQRIGQIARRAGNDYSSDTSSDDEGMTEEQLQEHRRRKLEAKREREKTAKMMDLQYFLEMVDHKHRYGSHLRAYHEQWKKAKTNENFFYWLDYGEGRNFELPTVSREKLEKDQIRYLSREERLNYLVKIDSEGKLCWAKNGERITTNANYYKDSVNGIVPNNEDVPAFRRDSDASSLSTISSQPSDASNEVKHYVNQDLKQAKGIKKLQMVTPAVILSQLLQRSVKPGSWIFVSQRLQGVISWAYIYQVADTSFRLYVGIKQSGAFQHSSFLHGARISAAGLIKIKDGQLRRLSPLSGHYRPPTANFRAFVHSLKDTGVDMSRVSISRSYAILWGLEVYVRSTKKLKHGAQNMTEHKDKMVHPEEVQRREEERRDKSQSAQKERQLLADKTKKNEEKKDEMSFTQKMLRKLRIRSGSKGSKEPASAIPDRDILTAPHQDAESGIPPQGAR
ncbi:hypothetical protein LTS18_002757 [Coniosporium uncinatum]|uniref:Uncharacterized protein n=1 Tax=Coniosporium uncinatum TaxID=93489 RepID=A0ACC3D7K4_9PEZI|nr:hypothetical protein LTS18_002757 [Coniosporium uncinatum]